MKHSVINNRKAILLFIALFSISSLFAQQVTPGIRIGANLSAWNISGSEEATPSSIINPEFETFLNIRLGKSFSIEPGISYATIGSALTYDGADKITYKLNYIQLPIVARYTLASGLSFSGGLQPGFLLKANGSNKSGDKQNVKKSFSKNDFAIVAGLQYCFPFGMGIGAKYTAGLSDVLLVQNVDLTNYSFGLNLSYQFRAAKRK